MTNEELIVDIMNYGPGGALQQLFVIEAVRRYAEQVSQAGPDAIDMGAGFIDGPAWVRAATYINNRIEENYA